ncbi:uncharacterized protein BHQ10_002124 [Talaromyces amestolkiae]|uniref:Uncharacterized protein n=1 Tax=Talaromyces amestolkiae TaxID=1196081 RepID=A0A364KRD0_TALAM|nr:uncharacterized protein BHQ10_002124 [Talaromyces amestolkiae]RAO66112.1 hypothetical protein BHQ10_002124 [Talaromyces amestolkiae]
MGNGFKKVKASFVGSHKNSDKIPQWLRAHGGEYSREIDESVTHLIATESAMENNGAVERARQLKIKIVNYDWLEDSLMSKPYRPKREGPYLWDRILRERDDSYRVTKDGKKGRRGVDIEKILGEFQKEAQAVISDMEKLGYHLYVDRSTGSSYSATLVRHTLIKNRSRKETFVARVYETNKEPHTYTTFVKYTRVGVASKDMLAPKGSSLEQALFAFKKFFRVKTGVEWKDRYDDSKLLVSPKASTNGESLLQPSEGAWFRYERPGGLMGALNNDAVSVNDQDVQDDEVSRAKAEDVEENKEDDTTQSVY